MFNASGKFFNIDFNLTDNSIHNIKEKIFSTSNLLFLALSDKCSSTPPPPPTCDDGIQNGDETVICYPSHKFQKL